MWDMWERIETIADRVAGRLGVEVAWQDTAVYAVERAAAERPDVREAWAAAFGAVLGHAATRGRSAAGETILAAYRRAHGAASDQSVAPRDVIAWLQAIARGQGGFDVLWAFVRVCAGECAGPRRPG